MCHLKPELILIFEINIFNKFLDLILDLKFKNQIGFILSSIVLDVNPLANIITDLNIEYIFIIKFYIRLKVA